MSFRVIWNFLIPVRLRNMKNPKFNIFLIDSIFLESPFDYLSINIVSWRTAIILFSSVERRSIRTFRFDFYGFCVWSIHPKYSMKSWMRITSIEHTNKNWIFCFIDEKSWRFCTSVRVNVLFLCFPRTKFNLHFFVFRRDDVDESNIEWVRQNLLIWKWKKIELSESNEMFVWVTRKSV